MHKAISSKNIPNGVGRVSGFVLSAAEVANPTFATVGFR